MATDVVTIGSGFGKTDRQDAWWVGPAATAIVLGLFVVYGTFRALYNAHYVVESATSAYLLSPFFSPLIIWDGMPTWLSPAFLILWAPGGFRLTCYYYRKAYYRAFLLDPPACSVSEPRKKYHGETRLFIFQNLHRYFLYVAIIFIFLLAIDSVHGFIWPDGFGVSVGSLILVANTTLLALYTFSCHSFRHLIGGKLDCFDCPMGKTRYQAWKKVSCLNERHMLFAWLSLFMVGFTDFYIWMVSSGAWSDLRLI